MTDPATQAHTPAGKPAVLSEDRLRRRHAAERRFRAYGVASIGAAVCFLMLLLTSIAIQGYSAFTQSFVRLDVFLDEEVIDPFASRTSEALEQANYQALARRALTTLFPDVTARSDKLRLYGLLSDDAGWRLRDLVLADPTLIGSTQSLWLKTSDDIDLYVKGHIDASAPEDERRVTDDQLAWIGVLAARGDVERRFNRTLFTAGDSREPEQAGIFGAVVGSALTLLVTLALSFPIGVLAAIHLEEFAPKNRWTDLIEVNINNLAAVPSIVFGLLGLAVFLNFAGLPRSTPLVGGMVLALMTLPRIVIPARAAIAAVPPSIREAALAVGASPMQVVTHHVLPLAMPGILTGTIIGMAQALGETAPLLMIGMVAFIADIPGGFSDPATVLPVQIYIWADSPERAFVAKTAGAILVLLGFLISMNAAAVTVRRRFERRW